MQTVWSYLQINSYHVKYKAEEPLHKWVACINMISDLLESVNVRLFCTTEAYSIFGRIKAIHNTSRQPKWESIMQADIANNSDWLWVGRLGDWGSIAGTGEMTFSSILCVQTSRGVHSASCTMGTGGSFPWAKARPRGDADHSPPYSAEVDNE
jgi:hypothetical protein